MTGLTCECVFSLVSGISANPLVLFARLCGVLFRGEMPDGWFLAGALISVVGLITLRLPDTRDSASEGLPCVGLSSRALY